MPHETPQVAGRNAEILHLTDGYYAYRTDDGFQGIMNFESAASVPSQARLITAPDTTLDEVRLLRPAKLGEFSELSADWQGHHWLSKTSSFFSHRPFDDWLKHEPDPRHILTLRRHGASRGYLQNARGELTNFTVTIRLAETLLMQAGIDPEDFGAFAAGEGCDVLPDTHSAERGYRFLSLAARPSAGKLEDLIRFARAGSVRPNDATGRLNHNLAGELVAAMLDEYRRTRQPAPALG